MSAGDDIRACLAVSAEAGHVPALRDALAKVAERLDQADEHETHERQLREMMLATIHAQTDSIRALQAKVAALEHRTIGLQVLGGQG